MSPDVCPICGAEIPPGAKACPECGSDEQTGWSEEARTDSLDLPEENFDYDDFVKREFGEEKQSPVSSGIDRFWWIVTLIILLGFIIAFYKLLLS